MWDIDLTHEISSRLAEAHGDALPVLYVFQMVGTRAEAAVFSDPDDRTSARLPVSDEVLELSHALKERMAADDRGAWISLEMLVQPGGDERTRFNYFNEVGWDAEPPAAAWEAELAAHPRDSDDIPAWWDDKIEAADDPGDDPQSATP